MNGIYGLKFTTLKQYILFFTVPCWHLKHEEPQGPFALPLLCYCLCHITTSISVHKPFWEGRRRREGHARMLFYYRYSMFLPDNLENLATLCSWLQVTYCF